MESENKIKSKSNTNLSKIRTNRTTTAIKPKTPDMELESQIFRRSMSTSRSPTPKRIEVRVEARQAMDRQVPLLDLDSNGVPAVSEDNRILKDIKNERT